jgi:hypothetical protein
MVIIIFEPMIVHFRAIGIFFLLAVFSFPATMKAVHDLSHSHDPVCNISHGFHFHESHHDCSLCDFNSSFNKMNFVSGQDIFSVLNSEYLVFFYQINFESVNSPENSSRAPPFMG